jgi:hypothetical protein
MPASGTQARLACRLGHQVQRGRGKCLPIADLQGAVLAADHHHAPRKRRVGLDKALPVARIDQDSAPEHPPQRIEDVRQAARRHGYDEHRLRDGGQPARVDPLDRASVVGQRGLDLAGRVVVADQQMERERIR